MPITRELPMMNEALEQAIREVHTYGLYYTERQLYYAYARASQRVGQGRQRLRWGVLAALPAAGLYRRPRWAVGLATAATGLTLGALWGRDTATTSYVTITEDEFREALAASHAPPPGLLPSMAQPAWGLDEPAREPDLADYGIDSLLICQSAEIAAMLRANDVHVHLGCGIVTAPPPPELIQMLERSDNPCVYYLHDASLIGLQTAYDLPARLGLPFIPMGLRPIHAIRWGLLCRTPPVDPDQAPLWHPYYLSNAERLWLEAGYMAEVAAVPPLELIEQVERVISNGALSLLPRETRLDKAARLLLGKVE